MARAGSIAHYPCICRTRDARQRSTGIEASQAELDLPATTPTLCNVLSLGILQRHWSLLSRRFDIADNLGILGVCVLLDITDYLGPAFAKMVDTLED